MIYLIATRNGHPASTTRRQYELTNRGLSSCKRATIKLLTDPSVQSVILHGHGFSECYRSDGFGKNIDDLDCLSLRDFGV